MPLRSRVTRSLLIAAAVAGFAASGGTALAAPSENGLQHSSDNTPGGAATAVDNHRPAGAGGGRKVG
jgi:hypothetical protein